MSHRSKPVLSTLETEGNWKRGEREGERGEGERGEGERGEGGRERRER